ncbi:lipid II:glycine glycyltransferase FemX [Paludibaculum fermentans]|uniref:lipid II:glycine glycyltransferase FemX n=1 Tax=Paludibaculum fermentans TaxID=1473598 RepID=UPI003EBFD7B0
MPPVLELDPLTDPRWPALVNQHPSASVFHSRGWLDALRSTYGYTPSVLTTSKPGDPLANALVFCRVDSWLTGRRLISLPFSDFCEPLAATSGDLAPLFAALQHLAATEHHKYLELRPLTALAATPPGLQVSQTFYHHVLDLGAGADSVYRQLHRDCIQRKIRRAAQEGVVLNEGTTSADLGHFHRLLLQTRRRHGVPPQPLAWFQNLTGALGEAAVIRLACKDGQPVAAIFTAIHGNTLYYKYGASDARFHPLGAMPFLFWHAIQDAIQRGLEFLDLGRTDCDNPGLIRFKEHLGAARSTISYWRAPSSVTSAGSTWTSRWIHTACTHLPDRALDALGSLLYRHVA